jgi:hypothetical protein
MRKALAAIGLIFLFSCGYTMAITEPQVNKNLQKTFPLKKSYSFSGLKVATVELLDPQVRLLGNDTAKVKLRYKISAPFLKGKEGVIDAKAKVVYDPKSKTIYLADLIPENLGGPTERKLLSEALKRIGKLPIYRFEGSKAKLIKKIKVEKGKILVNFGV